MNELPGERGLALAPLLRRAGSIIESEIRGSSMGRALPDGSRIRIRCRADEEYGPGTVIAFITPAGLVGHRVVAVRRGPAAPTMFFTRGDAALVCDGPVRPDWVLGEVSEWFDGSAWRPLAPPPALGTARRAVAGGIVLLINALALASVEFSARVSGLLLRLVHRPARSEVRTGE
jgi:hypothetical protein